MPRRLAVPRLARVVNPERLEYLRSTLYKVTPFRAEDLEPGELEEKGWFVNVFRAGSGGEVVDDPILDIVEQIAWSGGRPRMIGLTGGTGVGKTTQIGRLARVLGDQHGIACVTMDYGEFNELSSPPDVTDFLLSLVGGFAVEAARADLLPKKWNEVSIGKRMLEILKRLKLPDIEVTIAGTASVTVLDLLREDETFRRRLRDHMTGRVSEVIQEVRQYAGEIASAVVDHYENCTGVALVVDSTEKLAAPGSAQQQMQACVRNLFVQNGDNLAFPEIHTIYLVPPWLPVSDGGALRMPLCQFPAIRVETPGAQPEGDTLGFALMDELVRNRMPEIEELIKLEDLRKLYRMSGGVLRVLFQLLHGVARRSRGAASLPVAAGVVDSAISTIREDYLAVTVEAAPWLARIQDTSRLDGLPSDALASLGAYFQAMVVLQFANGTKWYAIHPLMRERVRRAQEGDG
jgi:hypothetical protein